MTYIVDPRRDPRWEGLINSHPAASVFCTAGWLDALARTYNYTPVAYTTSPPLAPLENALVLCQISSWLTGRRLVALPFSDHCQALVNSHEEMDELLEALRREVDSGEYAHFELRPTGLPLCAGGLKPGDKFLLHELDLRPSLKDLFSSFHVTGVQQMIRRAEREGLTYEEGRSEHLLREFYELMLLTRRRHQLPPAPLAWFHNLLACLPGHAAVRVAANRGQAVAAILTLTFGKTVVYKYGCSDASQHKLGGIAMLLWRAIQEAKARGVEKMDFGRTDLDNPGLTTFKERWGARATSLVYYRYPAQKARGARPWLNALGPKLVSVAPDRLLTAAGSMLYRHIG